MLKTLINGITKRDAILFFAWYLFSRLTASFVYILSCKIFNISKCTWWHYSDVTMLDAWGWWDSGWYMNIINNGYSTQGDIPNYGFFPLFPYLIKGLSYIFNLEIYITGLLLNNIVFILACWILYVYLKQAFNETIARRSIFIILVNPLSVFLSAYLSEPLTFFFIVLGFYSIQQSSKSGLAFVAFFNGFLRPTAVLLAIPLFIKQYVDQKKISIEYIVLYFLFPCGMLLFYFYLYHLTGNFFAYPDLKKHVWKNEIQEPFSLLLKCILFKKDWSHTISAYWVVFISLYFIIKRKTQPMAFTVLVLLFIWVMLIYGEGALLCIMRYSAPLFPIYVALAQSKINTKTGYLLGVISIIMQGIYLAFIGSGLYILA